jgi:hypothetical protein
MGEKRTAYNILIGKPEGKKSLDKPRRGWENNIKMDLKEPCCKSVAWIHRGQGRDKCLAFVNTVVNFHVP